MSSIINFNFQGRLGPGPVDVPGLQVNDKVLALYWMGGDKSVQLPRPGIFESIVSVDDQLQQQLVSDQRDQQWAVLVVRG